MVGGAAAVGPAAAGSHDRPWRYESCQAPIPRDKFPPCPGHDCQSWRLAKIGAQRREHTGGPICLLAGLGSRTRSRPWTKTAAGGQECWTGVKSKRKRKSTRLKDRGLEGGKALGIGSPDFQHALPQCCREGTR